MAESPEPISEPSVTFYVGPSNVKAGLVQNLSYVDSLPQSITNLSAKVPAIKDLLVSHENLASAQAALTSPNSGLSAVFKAVQAQLNQIFK
jgi:hypothetical protein